MSEFSHASTLKSKMSLRRCVFAAKLKPTAPLVLIQEPTVIDRLVSQLRAQLSEVSNADSVDQLSKPTLDAFGFSALGETEREQAFSLLRNPLQDADESSGKRLDELMAGS